MKRLIILIALAGLFAGCARHTETTGQDSVDHMGREFPLQIINVQPAPLIIRVPRGHKYLTVDVRPEPVHIVMERVTSKTLDCYVEFVSFDEAVNAVNRFEVNRTGGRGGHRVVGLGDGVVASGRQTGGVARSGRVTTAVRALG